MPDTRATAKLTAWVFIRSFGVLFKKPNMGIRPDEKKGGRKAPLSVMNRLASQYSILNPSCTCRGACQPVGLRKVAVETLLPPRAVGCWLLKALKRSK